jgi:hypothetical protein
LPTSANIKAHNQLKEMLKVWYKLKISIFHMMKISIL